MKNRYLQQRIATLLMAAVSIAIVIMAIITCRPIESTDTSLEPVTTSIISEGHLDYVEVDEVGCSIPESTTPYEYINSEMKVPCVWGGFELSLDEYYLLCTTVFCESGNQDIECQIMTCLTILNRIRSDEFPDTLREVIYQQGAYEVTHWKNFEHRGWTEQVEMAVTYALESNEYPPTMYWFRTGHFHNFATPYMQCGAHYFSYKE